MSLTMRDAFGQKAVELGKTNDRLVLLDADVSSSTKSGLFGKAFPDRFFNCGVGEANMVGVAAGLAAAGMHPLVNSFALFLVLKSTDQIRNDLCYNKLPVILAGAYSGLSDSYDGASHQAITDIAVMRAMPNMEVIAPADNTQAAQALEYALTRQNPVYIRLNRNSLPDLPASPDFASGAPVKLRDGSRVTIASTGITAAMCMEAAALLAKDGIDAEVFSVPFIKPSGARGIASSVQKTKCLVTVEEHNVVGGFGSSCLETLVSSGSGFAYDAIGIQDTFTETGGYDELLAKYGLSAAAIAERVKAFLAKR